ncbi:hypothetical protein [Capnocytophaga cynodegmi]|uniref:hypothetical protein n=1 Tax=Capnocytophaga cynodegmi TaxID=28189 RepID=UPI001EE2EA68|nr:hypothetical protein [Capnocytophaga cynodegmi]
MDYKRIYDSIGGNYSVEEMVVSKIEHYSSVGGSRSSGTKTLHIKGIIGSQQVIFYRTSSGENYGIEEFLTMYPDIDTGYKLKVIKFKHSSQVMLVEDNEFYKWRKHRIIMFFTSLIGIIVFGILLKKDKKCKVNKIKK